MQNKLAFCLIDGQLTLVQVMAWCVQAITWANVAHVRLHQIASLGLSELTILCLDRQRMFNPEMNRSRCS